jgi:glycerol-3-phosphate dehydrogenase
VIGAGSWGTAVAVLLARGGLEVQLGTRSPEQAESMAKTRENEKYLPGVHLPDGLIVKRAHEIELAGCDLVCLAVPSKALPAAVGAIGDRVGQRAAVLLLAKGLVAPMGALPNDYVAERIKTRAIACLGGPAHAKEACSGTAALVLGSKDIDLRTQLGEVFDEAGLVCERSDDVTGVEIAGAAKNATALAAATAESSGMNAAGIAGAEVWRECIAWAETCGADPHTFTGLAGIGDLTATIIAPQSRNRQAGELLGKGTPAAQIPAIIGQAAEGLDSVPLIAESVTRAGIEAPGLQGLTDLINGEIDAGEWLARLRRSERARRAA